MKLFYLPGSCALGPHIALEYIALAYEAVATQRRPSGFHQELSPATQHRRIFDAVARTASSLKRDRRFADSPLEEAGFEPSVPLLRKGLPREIPERLAGVPY